MATPRWVSDRISAMLVARAIVLMKERVQVSGRTTTRTRSRATERSTSECVSKTEPFLVTTRTDAFSQNIHPEVTTEEICNIIRGGILQQIRYIPDKHIVSRSLWMCSPAAQVVLTPCLVVLRHLCRSALRAGLLSDCVVPGHCPAQPSPQSRMGTSPSFSQTAGCGEANLRFAPTQGKQSGPTSPGIAMVVQSGGSRNVYVGSIEDFETYSDEKLRTDFGEYGEIELINFLKEKQCAFVNFTNITNAVRISIACRKSSPVDHLPRH